MDVDPSHNVDLLDRLQAVAQSILAEDSPERRASALKELKSISENLGPDADPQARGCWGAQSPMSEMQGPKKGGMTRWEEIDT